jgi:hypothetical protein
MREPTTPSEPGPHPFAPGNVNPKKANSVCS